MKPEVLKNKQPSWQNGLADMINRVDNKDSETMSVCFIEPLGSRLVVRVDPPKSISKLIVTPNKSKARPTTGLVVAVGQGLEHMMNKRVLFNQFSGTGVKFKGCPVWQVMQFEELVGVIPTDVEMEERAQDQLYDGEFS